MAIIPQRPVGVLRTVMLLVFALPLTSGCSPSTAITTFGSPEGPFNINSSKLKPFSAMYTVPRAKFGFTPLPKHASVTIEKVTSSEAMSAGYDVMLHIYSRTERTVSFKRVKNKYQWIGEQENWTGPHLYKLPDGHMMHEIISITYETQLGDGLPPPNVLNIQYFGDDPRLSGKESLRLRDVQPVLKGWGEL